MERSEPQDVMIYTRTSPRQGKGILGPQLLLKAELFPVLGTRMHLCLPIRARKGLPAQALLPEA